MQYTLQQNLQQTMLRALLCLVFGSIFLPHLWSKSNDSISYTNRITLGVQQIKESQNFGLVFTGMTLGYAPRWQWEGETSVSQLSAEFAASALFSKGIMGANVHVMPVEWLYLWKVAPSLYIGSVLAADYRYQLYPDLQSGVSYWFSSWSAGIAAEYRFRAFETDWSVVGSSSLLGFSSRPPVVREPYFFDLGIGEAVRYLHQNIQFGSVNHFTRTRLEIAWKPNNDAAFRVSYIFEADVYFNTPQWTALSQGIAIILNKVKNYTFESTETSVRARSPIRRHMPDEPC